TGEAAYRLMNGQISLLKEAAVKLKTNPRDILQRIEALLGEIKELQRENESLTAKLNNYEAQNIIRQVKEVNGVKVLAAKVQKADMNTLRNMADELKEKLGSGVIVLGSPAGEKVNL